MTHIISSTAPTYAPCCHPLDLWTDPAGGEELQADGQRSWLVDLEREDRTPHISKGHRRRVRGQQEQQNEVVDIIVGILINICVH